MGLTSINRKNLPIVVTLGGEGSCFASLTYYPLASLPSTNYVIIMTFDKIRIFWKEAKK
jgi:hypothetical protein